MTADGITIHFFLSVDNPTRCKSSLLLGSLRELGEFQDGGYGEMNRIDGGTFEYTAILPSLVVNFEYQYVLVDIDGRYTLGDRRLFTIPRSKFAHVNSNLVESGSMTIEVRSSFGDSSMTSVHVFVPGDVLSSDVLQCELSRLQQENESLKKDISRISALLGSPEPVQPNPQIQHLLNEINELRGKVRVVGRFRPLMDFDETALEYAQHQHTDGTCSVVISDREYLMDDVFGEAATNEELFKRCEIGSLMESAVIIGNSVCVFCYGQTGSGKSYTMMGDEGDPGVIELALEELFEAIGRNKVERRMQVEVMEIYMDQVFSIFEKCQVGSMEEIMELYRSAVDSRATATTNMNETSSRSHFIFVVGLGESCQIFFVDLAGSERTKITNAQGDRLMEANSINKSLSTLGLVMNGLLNKSNPFIPFRDSKLTKILAPVFTRTSPASKILMIANLSPNAEDVRETISTLGFAQRVGRVEMKLSEKREVEKKLILLEQLKNR